MEREGGLGPVVNPQTLPKWLLMAAVGLSLIGFTVGWFSVDTEVRAWRYDPSDDSNTDGDPRGAGDPLPRLPPRVKLDTEMKFLSLGADINPNDLQTVVETSTDFPPTYSEHFGNTGTAMLGVMLLHAMATLTIAALLGVYLWHLRSDRDLSRSLLKFLGLYTTLVAATGLSLAFSVPDAAEQDVRDMLHSYQPLLETVFPSVTPSLFDPEVRFWYTWICCPPRSNFPHEGTQVLVVSTTTSRPSVGFWLDALAVASTLGAIVLAHRAGQLEPKVELPPRVAGPAPVTRT